ncbi:MAG TPA: ABC-ATPase UvrA, partial [bacterium]|nr:ABC-ATPase UvrA [bacterium]
MKKKHISIVNASEHNLKNITLNIPRNAISVITGISGSGKSSLAFDTIYAEGNRRYVESMSSYARQFIDAIKKPEAESIEGLSPSLAINQKTISHNPRSTVGTMTEIYDYLRLLYAKVGDPFCHKCSNPIQARTASDIAKEYCSMPLGTKLTISSPIVRGKKGEYSKLLQKLLADGFTKISIDGKIRDLDDDIRIDKNKTHNIELIIDKIVTNENCIQRMTDSVSLSMKLSGGIVKIIIEGEKQEHVLSDKYSCLDCGISYADIEPRIFSFNSPYGACPECAGIGKIKKDEDSFVTCPICNGTRLKKESLSIKIDQHSIYDLSSMSMSSLKKVLLDLNIPQNKKIIADTIIKEITERL